MQLADLRVRRQRANNRVLSPAGPNHKYAHDPGAYPLEQRPERERLVTPRSDADGRDRRAG
jgi:hypothetical protein